jgi:hypothetical protein
MSDNIINKILTKDSMSQWRRLKYRKIYIGAMFIFSALVLALSPVLSMKAFATSDYGVNVTDSLSLGGVGTYTCSVVDMTKTVAEILADDESVAPYSYKNSWSYQAQYPWNARYALEDFADQFHDRLLDGAGWAISQLSAFGSYIPEDTGYAASNKSIRIYLFDPAATFTFEETYGTGNGWFIESSHPISYVEFFLNSNGSDCRKQFDANVGGGYLVGQTWILNPIQQEFLMMATDNITYPLDFSGDSIPDTITDNDGDGLTAAFELTQGSSDSVADSDGDGLSDYIESVLFEDRDDVFCGTECAYPIPYIKDLYYEIDWMDDGTTAYKPSSTQLGLVKDMFANHGILFHADTGQYGGGNELDVYEHYLLTNPTSLILDYSDYKNGSEEMFVEANFSSDRESIWRYMISGNAMQAPNASIATTGWATELGSDAFIAYGVIVNMDNLVDVDRAVAGTIAHEIGHNLCLSNESIWEETPSGCAYDGIDNDDDQDSEYNLSNYESVMNYLYQTSQEDADSDDLEIVDFSDGTHGAGDHDDWSAIMNGIGKFSGSHTSL